MLILFLYIHRTLENVMHMHTKRVRCRAKKKANCKCQNNKWIKINLQLALCGAPGLSVYLFRACYNKSVKLHHCVQAVFVFLILFFLNMDPVISADLAEPAASLLILCGLPCRALTESKWLLLSSGKSKVFSNTMSQKNRCTFMCACFVNLKSPR